MKHPLKTHVDMASLYPQAPFTPSSPSEEAAANKPVLFLKRRGLKNFYTQQNSFSELPRQNPVLNFTISVTW